MLILDLLARSAAAEGFRTAVEAFVRTGEPGDALRFDAYAPPVKVERTLIQLLTAHASLPIDAVTIHAASGCEFFRGTLEATAAEERLTVEFEWNCRWKAEQMGWKDWFGFADQTRAARELGHDCFRVWAPVAAPQAVPA
jgi:hypothetical protein